MRWSQHLGAAGAPEESVEAVANCFVAVRKQLQKLKFNILLSLRTYLSLRGAEAMRREVAERQAALARLELEGRLRCQRQ